MMIIAALILLFVPTISGQREKALSQGNQALVLVVREQYELFRLDKPDAPLAEKRLSQGQLEALLNEGFLTQAQVKRYNELPGKYFE